MRGWSLLWVIPVASALNMDMPVALLSSGRTASMNRMMPRPPIHWVSARQKRTPWEWASTSESILAPVVVKPEIISNIPSVNPIGLSLSISGISPKRPNTTQTVAVMMNPSRARMVVSALRRVSASATPPATTAAAAPTANPRQSDSP